MTRTSNRAQRFSVMCAVAAVVSLGWSPLQALADDGAIDLVGSTVAGATDQVAGATDQVAAAVTATDPVDAVSEAASSTVEAVATTAADPIEAVSDAASNTVGNVADPVTNTVGNVVDPVTNTVGNVVDPVTNTVGTVADTASNTVGNVVDPVTNTVGNVADTASNTVGNVANTVGDSTAAVGGAAGNVASGALSVGQANETSTATGSTPLSLFSSQQATADQRSSGGTRRSVHDDLVLLAERGRATAPLGDEASGSCVSIGTACVTNTAGDAQGSWEGSVASVIQKLLALTGSGLLTWIAASCILTVMGALALHESKRRSEGSLLRSA